MSSIYRTEENFGGKKLWRMNLTAELAKKNFGEWNLLQKNFTSVHQQSTRWRRGMHVRYSVNPSSKRLHTTILEMDAPF